jgi:hypothetical protein
MFIIRILIVFILINFKSFGQLSPNAKVYLLTCESGDEIYTQFGHSAIRIVDHEASLDNVYNWGMFEFDEDETAFMMKFARGKLPYYMGVQSFDGFMAEYIYFNRTVRQLELNLNQTQTNELYAALQINYLPENRVYKYDFFFDNCASRIRDFFVKVVGESLKLGKHKDADLFSYRTIITPRLTDHPWTHFGINLVLGARIDAYVTNENLMFLPEYMEQIFMISQVEVEGKKEPFVLSQETIFEGAKIEEKSSLFFTPNIFSWSIFGLIVLLLFFKWNKSLRVLGMVLIFCTSLLGLILLLMWFATDHQATKMNYNLIWANPLLIILPFLMLTSAMFKRMYYVFRTVAFIHLSFIVMWIFLPQEFDLPTKGLILAQGLLFYAWQKESKGKNI